MGHHDPGATRIRHHHESCRPGIRRRSLPAVSEQMGIDATIKVPERFSEYREVSQADPADVARIAELLRPVLGEKS